MDRESYERVNAGQNLLSSLSSLEKSGLRRVGFKPCMTTKGGRKSDWRLIDGKHTLDPIQTSSAVTLALASRPSVGSQLHRGWRCRHQDSI